LKKNSFNLRSLEKGRNKQPKTGMAAMTGSETRKMKNKNIENLHDVRSHL